MGYGGIRRESNFRWLLAPRVVGDAGAGIWHGGLGWNRRHGRLAQLGVFRETRKSSAADKGWGVTCLGELASAGDSEGGKEVAVGGGGTAAGAVEGLDCRRVAGDTCGVGVAVEAVPGHNGG